MTTTTALFAPRPAEYAADLFDLLTETETTAPAQETTVTETPAPAYDLSGKNTYVAALSNGTIDARSSATMDYTHAVEACRDGKHFAWSWHKSGAAAVKAARTVPGGIVVEVTAYPYSSPEAKAARAATGKK